VLAAVLSVTAGTAIVKEKADLEAGVSYAANTKKQKELAAYYPSGKTVICDESFMSHTGKLLTEASNNLPEIRELIPGEKFTTTGEVRFATKSRASEDEVWLQVNDNGTTGWVFLLDLHWISRPGGTSASIEEIEDVAAKMIGTWIDDESNRWVFDNAGKVAIGTLGSMDYSIIDDKRMTMTFPDGNISEVDIQMSTDGKSLTLSYSNDGGHFTHKLTKR
jgi:hypothetical protein